MSEGRGVEGLQVVTAAEDPGLWDEHDPVFETVWPEYNTHGNDAGRYFSVLLDRYPEHQFLVLDAADGRAVARGRTIPLAWDGTLDDLPTGIDAAGIRAVESDRRPTALCALAAEVLPGEQGGGLSGVVLQTMATGARRAGLDPLIAPVRPSWKHRYPLADIAAYASWTRSDGLPFDPWMRVHTRLGATILRPEPRSMRITAPVTDWEAWIGLDLPADGAYTFPEGLAPLQVTNGTGHYWEPNVWMLHQVTDIPEPL